jgi:hypothetical protein
MKGQGNQDEGQVAIIMEVKPRMMEIAYPGSKQGEVQQKI